MFDKIFAAIAIGVIMVTVAYGAKVNHENASLKRDLDAAELKLSVSEQNLETKSKLLAQALSARAVLQTHLDRTAAAAEQWEQIASDLLEKDGADEALNDYERGVLERLRTP
jgi:GMP synthase-like glutamine amidotransferase